jgi:hypothetical protein
MPKTAPLMQLTREAVVEGVTTGAADGEPALGFGNYGEVQGRLGTLVTRRRRHGHIASMPKSVSKVVAETPRLMLFRVWIGDKGSGGLFRHAKVTVAE